MGLGDMLKLPSLPSKGTSDLIMATEMTDPLKASSITFKFISFKPHEKISQTQVPRRMLI